MKFRKIIENNKFKDWYGFDIDIFEAMCYFIEKYGETPATIALNNHTYSQICYILSISPKGQFYSGKNDKKGFKFSYIVLNYKEYYDSKSYQNNEPRCHYDEYDYQNPYARPKKSYARDSAEFREMEEFKNSLIEGGVLAINNPFDIGYAEFETECPGFLSCMIDEDIKDREFELSWVDIEDEEDDDDDDDDNFGDDVPDLPIEGLVKKKELVLDLL